MAKRYSDLTVIVSNRPGVDGAFVRVLGPGVPDSADETPVPSDPSTPTMPLLLMDGAPDPIQCGQSFFQSVFGPVAPYIVEALNQRSDPTVGVRICVIAEQTGLAEAAWEVLTLPASRTFLTINPRTPVVRTLGAGSGYRRLLDHPLRILVLLASTNTASVDVAGVRTALDKSYQSALAANTILPPDYVGFDRPEDATFEELLRRLALHENSVQHRNRNEPYDVVHLICHGVFDEAAGGGEVVLRSPGGNREQRLSADILRNAIETGAGGPQLVILQACETATTGSGPHGQASVAEIVLKAGVPAVLAMQETIDQDLAAQFVGWFYEKWLAGSNPIEEALAYARAQAQQSKYCQPPGKACAWAIPVLYTLPFLYQLTPAGHWDSRPGRAVEQPVAVTLAAVSGLNRQDVASPRRDRVLDAALPDKVRMGRAAQLIVMVRLPDRPGLAAQFAAHPLDQEARPEDVRTSSGFDAPFTKDRRGGWQPAELRLQVDSDDFDVQPANIMNIRLRAQGDDWQAVFRVTPRQPGIARLIVAIYGKNQPNDPLQTVRLGTEVVDATAPAFIAATQVVGGLGPEQTVREFLQGDITHSQVGQPTMQESAAGSFLCGGAGGSFLCGGAGGSFICGLVSAPVGGPPPDYGAPVAPYTPATDTTTEATTGGTGAAGNAVGGAGGTVVSGVIGGGLVSPVGEAAGAAIGGAAGAGAAHLAEEGDESHPGGAETGAARALEGGATGAAVGGAGGSGSGRAGGSGSGRATDDTVTTPQAARSTTAPAPALAGAPAVETCRNCGAPLRPGATFCTRCGTRVVQEAPNRCPNCDEEVSPGGMYCDQCGTRLTGTATVPSVTALPVAPVAPPAVAPPASVPPEQAAQRAPAPVAPVTPVEPDAPVVPTPPGMPAPAVPPALSGSTGQPRLELAGSGNVIDLPNKDEILIGCEDSLSNPPIFPDVDLTPYGGEEGGVSRRHALLLRRDNDYFVEDLQSTNYTKLNGQRLAPRQPALLVDGTRVDFGKVSVLFRR